MGGSKRDKRRTHKRRPPEKKNVQPGEPCGGRLKHAQLVKSAAHPRAPREPEPGCLVGSAPEEHGENRRTVVMENRRSRGDKPNKKTPDRRSPPDRMSQTRGIERGWGDNEVLGRGGRPAESWGKVANLGQPILATPNKGLLTIPCSGEATAAGDP